MADEEFIQNLMQQVHELWINPEIERRRGAGRLPDDFAISKAQVIMNVDADSLEVRFNEEVIVLAEAEWTREVEDGENVTAPHWRPSGTPSSGSWPVSAGTPWQRGYGSSKSCPAWSRSTSATSPTWSAAGASRATTSRSPKSARPTTRSVCSALRPTGFGPRPLRRSRANASPPRTSVPPGCAGSTKPSASP
jgi:hypothetical protein